MKKIKFNLLVLSIKIRLLFYKLRNKIITIKQLVTNIWHVFFTNKSEAKIFTGILARWLAVKYANKRSEISAVNKLCGGKRHYVVNYGKDRLLVINKTEMNMLKSKHLFRKSYNILSVLEHAFYVTPNKVKA